MNHPITVVSRIEILALYFLLYVRGSHGHGVLVIKVKVCQFRQIHLCINRFSLISKVCRIAFQQLLLLLQGFFLGLLSMIPSAFST